MDATFTTTARVWGNEDFSDQHQDVDIEYSGSGLRKFTATYCKILTPLELEPRDLYTDLCSAITEDMHAVTADIECDIELTELIRK